MSRVKIVTFVPAENADAVRDAMCMSGAGQIGEYSFCSNTSQSEGRFMPSDSATPYIGQKGVLETVKELRIEVVCSRDKAKAVISAMKSAHPYEEVAFDIYQLVDEDEL